MTETIKQLLDPMIDRYTHQGSLGNNCACESCVRTKALSFLDKGLVCTRYVLKSEYDSFNICPVTFEMGNSPFYKGDRWAVRHGSQCLGKDFEWIWEPMPSTRDTEFYNKYRFDSLELAYQAYLENQKMAIASVNDKGSYRAAQ